jgi:hypothetical protein
MMTGLSMTLGRGLLILALASTAFACGDDDGGDDHEPDSGADAGGSGGSGGGDDGGAGSGPVTVAECVTEAKAVTMSMTSDECLSCACTEGLAEVTACNATCWALIDCFGSPAKCADVDTTDTAAAVTCIMMSCPNVDIAMAMASGDAATALGTVLSDSCSTQCATAAPADGGMAGTGGGDTDGGDADGG